MPPWLKRPLPAGDDFVQTGKVLSRLGLNTICREASCPNIGECWARRIATFLVLGSQCTRGCRFCNVGSGKPQPVDSTEPARVAQAVKELGLVHVVITMVTRDDLPGGGAEHVSRVLDAVHQRCPETSIEFLSSDFKGNWEVLPGVLHSGVDIWGHNMETVPRLYEQARPGADYQRSLELFRRLHGLDSRLALKSGLMLGLGESLDEVIEVLKDLRSVNVDRVTLGQYLAPTERHLPVREFIPPELFEELAAKAADMGFQIVESHPFARSSYYSPEHAKQLFPAGNKKE